METYMAYEPIALAVVIILGIIYFIYCFIMFPDKGADRPRKSDYWKESPDEALWEASQQSLELDLAAQKAKEQMDQLKADYRESTRSHPYDI